MWDSVMVILESSVSNSILKVSESVKYAVSTVAQFGLMMMDSDSSQGSTSTCFNSSEFLTFAIVV